MNARNDGRLAASARSPGTAQEALTEQDAVEHVHGICFKTGPPGRVGVELEWLVCDVRDPALPVGPERVAAALGGLGRPGGLPGRGCVTTEPGGQLELSSWPAADIAECVAATSLDLAAIRAALAAVGLHLVGRGLDPVRPPRRVLDLPRYAAMEEFFDRSGPAGRAMMCSTASVQVCVEAGEDTGDQDYRNRWQVLNAIAPVLVAAFANSPLRQGRPTGWRSTRQAIWAELDPSRTRPVASLGAAAPPGRAARWPAADPGRPGGDAGAVAVPGPWPRGDGAGVAARSGGAGRDAGARIAAPGGRPRGTDGAGAAAVAPGAPAPYAACTIADPRGRWADFALDAQVMCIRRDGGTWSAPPGLTFRGWLRGAAVGRYPPPGAAWPHAPTIDDLNYHLTTLFPPVRPRGHVELRVIDAQQGDGWVVPAVVVHAILDDPRAREVAMAAAEPLWSCGGELWLRAARDGPADRDIGRAARACFEAAASALHRRGRPRSLLRALAGFAERYVERYRCPADDLLEEMA